MCACVQVYALIKKDVPQAWHEPATTYIDTSLLRWKINQAVEESMAFESMAFWLNRCTLSLRCANANSISRRRKQKTRDLRHLTFQVSVIIIDAVKLTPYLYSNVNKTYWTSGIIFSLAYHLKSLHLSIILQIKHYIDILFKFACLPIEKRMKN